MKIDRTVSDNAVLKEIGKRITQYRLSQNLSQNSLSKEAGVSRPTVQRAEYGQSIQLTNLIRILRVLNLVENLEVLIPEAPVSPIERLEREGKKRKRASSILRKKQDKPNWSWEDDE